MRDRKGITPAVAVALLLVVAIAVSSAIVYSVTRSTPTTTEKAPTATFSVEISKKGAMGYGYIHIRQISGDPIPTSDVKIIFSAKSNTTTVQPGLNYMFVSYDTSDPPLAVSGTESNGTSPSYTKPKFSLTFKFVTAGGNEIPMAGILVELYNVTGHSLLGSGSVSYTHLTLPTTERV